MLSFTKSMPMNDNGRVVIPKEVRDVIGVQSGDEIFFIFNGETVEITTRKILVNRLCGIFKTDDGRDWTEELLQERREEASRKWL